MHDSSVATFTSVGALVDHLLAAMTYNASRLPTTSIKRAFSGSVGTKAAKAAPLRYNRQAIDGFLHHEQRSDIDPGYRHAYFATYLSNQRRNIKAYVGSAGIDQHQLQARRAPQFGRGLA